MFLIAGAAVFAVQSYNDDRAQYPALVGGINASGIFDGTAEGEGGEHVLVSFIPVDTPAIARSLEPVTDIDETATQQTFKVYYLPEDTSRTFIDGVDHVEVDWMNQGVAGGALLIGLILFVIPFKVRSRVRRPTPSRRHAA